MLHSLRKEISLAKHWPTIINMVSLCLACRCVVGRHVHVSSSLPLKRSLKDVYSKCSGLPYSSSRLEELGVDCPQFLQAADLILGSLRARQWKALLHQVRSRPSELLCLGAVQIRVIYTQSRLALASSEGFTRRPPTYQQSSSPQTWSRPPPASPSHTWPAAACRRTAPRRSCSTSARRRGRRCPAAGRPASRG